MIRLISILFFSLYSLSLMASDSVSVLRIDLRETTVEVKIHDFINDRGQREMRFETHNLARLVLGFGRDIDGDGIVETFFVNGTNGMATYTKNHPRMTSWERATSVLSEHAKYSGKVYFASLAEGLTSFLFFGMDHLLKAQETYYQDWMDLTELFMVLEQNQKFMTRDEYIYGLNLVIEGNHLAYERLDKALGSGLAVRWAGDIGMWLSGAVLLKWAARGLKAPIRMAGVGLKLTLRTYQQTIRHSIKAITLKGSLNRSKGLIVKGLKNIKAEWKYIAASMAAQGAAETYSYYDEVKDPNPATLALNLLHHPEVKENVSISMMDTLLMTGAAGVGRTKFARFAMIGTVGVVSSLSVGVGLNGSQTGQRLLFDSAWGLGVDAGQTMIELNVLHRFNEAALKSRKPHLKIIGYAVVFVSQVASFYAYSRAAQWVDPRTDLTEGEIQLVPVLANN
ncbi:MAG: hypothetical protein LW878_05720 [Proteobacteria bacterium]|nr:hypothetical protein [Pseudomonadota bacterium]